jgi:Holliday junction resolvase RusA-like endonuclease
MPTKDGLKITITGQTPSKKNARINTRSGRSFPSKRYTEWHKNSTKELETIQPSDFNWIKGLKCEINYMFYCQDLRRRDVSNMLESVNDLLVDLGILEDDDWKHVRIGWADADLDRENPRAELNIKPYRR